ncbi:nucleoporin, Nup153 [Culex quinquefasciatus]|uniref:Nuclear pore complex protein Nup153 n=1 Tax=Culex quinquefasciatus TaxID=7176 RepID=B0WJ48_CULQU|nr:nucleoporin, Nup153 [Culex quinquefasciatus]|eukprot:XP_001848732.1 nucleoporin, Nup153 [Culex quinquefasciatus]
MATTAAAAASVLNTSTDSNPDDDPNNSIIRKVRSRVSSIIPDALSKWFSPSAVKRPREMAESSSSPPPVAAAGRNGNLLRQLEEQHQQEEEGEEDEDEAPPTRKKKRVEERFNTSLGDFNDDLSALPGPSGLNISAIDRRSSLPMSATVPRGRSAFSSSTPSTSPQQQHQPSSQGGQFQRQQLQQRISHANRATVPYNFGAATAADPIDEEVAEVDDESGFSNSIRQRRSIREVSGRKRLNIPQTVAPAGVDRSISEPPVAPIFGTRSTVFGRSVALPQQSSNEDLRQEDVERGGGGGLLSNGNVNESASESSSVSNLNLSQSDQIEAGGSRRLSGFMGNVSRSKRLKVGGSTGDLCFSSHLETEKSLFSAKNAGRAGGVSGRPTFNASLYGSSSSLGSSNSSLFANSPFYNGKTMYGGASAYSARRDIRQKALRVPVQMRPASALSNFSSSNNSLASDTSALSNTAKRILEIMNQCSGPLSEARKLGSSLSLNSTLASAKVPGLVQARRRFNEEDLTINRSIRMSSPRTPYSRPQSASASNSTSTNKPPTNELQIPSISQLLQMKRLQTNTESVRRLATESNAGTILNEPTEYKLPGAAEPDDSNNNNSSKHTNKIRSKLHRVREESAADRDSSNPVPQLVLPEVQLAGLKSVPKFDIKVSSGSSVAATNGANKNGEPAWKKATSASETQPKMSTTSSSNSATTFKTNNSTILPASATAAVSKDSNAAAAYKFSSPAKLNLPQTPSKPATLNSFKFSNPEPLGKASGPAKLTGFQFNPDTAKVKSSVTPAATAATSVSPVKAPLPLKSGSCLDALKSGSCLEALAPKPAAPAAGFGNAFKLTGSNKWECDACMVRNDPDKTKCVSCETPKPGAKPAPTPVKPLTAAPKTTDAGFKALVAQQSARWECSDCMTRNEADKTSCACCSSPKPGAAPAAAVASAVPAAIKSMFTMPAAPASDQGFKSLVAQQAAGKWECSACMTRNEATRSKCACCEQAKPGSTPTDAPSFSFGSKPATASTIASSGFSFGVPPKNADSKESPKSGFSFGVPASSATPPPSSGGFSFGSKPTAAAAAPTSSDDKPKFSFGSSSSTTATTATPPSGTGFSFGAKPAADTTDSSKASEKKDEPKPATFGSGGFSFGAKPANEAPKKDSPSGGFSFGSPKPTATTTTAESSPVTFGKRAASPSPSSTPAEPTKPATVGFGTLASGSPSFSFGAKPAESKPASATTTPASGMFSFGSPKPVVGGAANTELKSSTTSSASPATTAAAPASSAATTATSVPIFGVLKSQPAFDNPAFSFSSSSTPASAVGPTPAANSSSSSSSTTAPAATSSTATVAPTFSFGAASTKPTEPPKAATPLGTGSSSFVFGQSSSQPAAKVIPSFGATADKPTTATFGSFGAPQPAPATSGSTSSIFGAAASGGASSAFSFTGASKPAEQSSPAFSFSAAAKPAPTPAAQTNSGPVFGSPAASAAAAAKPMFGSPAASSGTTTTFGGFGASAATAVGSNTTPTFGSSSFGSGATGASSTVGGQSAATSIFGQSSAPAFGAAPSGFGGMASGSPFGGAAAVTAASTDEPQAKKMFDFGGSSAVNNSQPAATPFQFGSGSNNNNNNNNDASGGHKPPFSFSAQSAPNFNFSAGSNAGQTSAPFTFGSGGQQQQPAPAGGMFTFGGGATTVGLGGMGERHKYAWPNPAAAAAAKNQRPPTYDAPVGGATSSPPRRRRYPAPATAGTFPPSSAPTPRTSSKHPNLVWTKDNRNTINSQTNPTTTAVPSYDKSRFKYVSPELKLKMAGNGNGGGQQEGGSGAH